MKADLSVELGRIKLRNPVLTASGTFGYGEEYNGLVDFSRLGGIITKAITLEPRRGNPPPRITETVGGMLNSIGLANCGVEAFTEEKMPFLREIDTAVIVNVAGSTFSEYEEVARKLDKCEGIDALELNVSCPNVKEGGMSFGVQPESLFEVVRRVKVVTDLPIIVKLTPNVTDIASMALVAQKSGADAVSLINTLVGMTIDVEKREPKLASTTGGLSGPAIKPVALAMVWKVASKLNIPVIGIGGIFSYMDALEFLIAGASAIQVGTANFVNPGASVEISDGIGNYLEEKNCGSVREIVGSLRTGGQI